MDRSRRDAGFTLIELLVVAGMIVVIIGTLGVFFLAGPSPAVASAGHDIGAAFAEARETAVAFSEATVVFTPAGTGYSARVYREMPGDSEFQSVNGPSYDSTVTIAETAAPLGAPGFAFRIDSRGSVTAYQHYAPGDTTFTTRSCPASGAFTLALAYGNQRRTVTIPCSISISSVAVDAVITPAPAATPAPDSPGTCPATQPCGAPLAAINATCPPGYTPDATPYVCDSPTPTATAEASSTAMASPTGIPTSAPASPTPTPIASPASSPYTVMASSGGHQILYVGWASWVEVDVDFNGAKQFEVCYGTATGPALVTSSFSVAYFYNQSALEAGGVPAGIASTALAKCSAESS